MRTLAHLSDLHFGRVDAAILEPLRRRIAALEPHLVVVSGDLTQRARKGQFREAREFLDSLPRPQLVVPGNHDVPLYNVFARFLAPLRNYRSIVTDELLPAFIDEEIAVVGVNTARSNVFKGGRINPEQVQAIREKLCPLPDSVVKVIVTHHPFDELGRAVMAVQKLAECGADLLLSGHLHEAHVGQAAERQRIAGLSALVVQAGTATSSRTRDSANSFNVLRLDARHAEIETYLWNGRDFDCATRRGFEHGDHGWH